MIWNILAASFLLWLSRRYEKQLKPGTLFAGWLILAGIGRAWIELFRPDQPKIPELGISYSAIVAALMAVTGAVILMIRYKGISVAFAEEWEEEYQITPPFAPQPVIADVEFIGVAEPVTPTPKRKPAVRKTKAAPAKKAKAKTAKRKPKKSAAK